MFNYVEQYDPITDSFSGISFNPNGKLTITYTGTGESQYVYDTSDPGSFTIDRTFQSGTDLFSIQMDGMEIIDNGEFYRDEYIANITWIDAATGATKVTTIYEMDFFDANNTYFSYTTYLAGALLPTFTTEAQFNAFGNQIVSVAEVTSGPFGPNTTVSFTGYPNSTTTENDLFRGDRLGAADDNIAAGIGNDTIFGFQGSDFLQGEDGNDTINGNSGNDSIEGGNGNDTLYGTSGFDTITGGADDDILSGGGDDDYLNGEAGNDLVLGGGGNDTLFGGADQDILSAGGGDDTLVGAAGNDELLGSSGNDTIFGGTGVDLLAGGTGNDTLTGANDSDTIFGANNDDFLYGGDAADFLYGGNQTDLVYGGANSDSLFGGAGNDTLFGGIGDDFYYGGADSDQFRFTDGNNTAFGYVEGVDSIYLDQNLADFGATPTAANALAYATQLSPGIVEFDFGNGNVVTLINGGGITLADLENEIFFF